MTLKCTACERKTLRIDGSPVATTVHTITCKCGARYRIVAQPRKINEQVMIHICKMQPLKPNKRTY